MQRQLLFAGHSCPRRLQGRGWEHRKRALMGTGIAADVLPDLDRMLLRRYELRCWDAGGRLAQERLEERGVWGGSCTAYQASA
jgi:hypothetical protein